MSAILALIVTLRFTVSASSRRFRPKSGARNEIKKTARPCGMLAFRKVTIMAAIFPRPDSGALHFGLAIVNLGEMRGLDRPVGGMDRNRSNPRHQTGCVPRSASRSSKAASRHKFAFQKPGFLEKPGFFA